MKMVLFALAVPWLAAGAVEIPDVTCVKSGSFVRSPSGSIDVTFSGPLDSCWRDVESAAVVSAFYPRKPLALQIVIR